MEPEASIKITLATLNKQANKYLRHKEYANAMCCYYQSIRITGIGITACITSVSALNAIKYKYKMNALKNIAEIYFKCKQYDKCIDKCNLMLSSNPSMTDYKTLYFRGISYYNISKPCKALTDLTKLYQTYPSKNLRKLMNKLQIKCLQQIKCKLCKSKPTDNNASNVPLGNNIHFEYLKTNTCFYKLEEIPFCGTSMVATTNIGKGCIILTDKPLIVYNNNCDKQIAEKNVLAAYDLLSDDKKREYDKLYSRDWIFKTKPKVIEIANTNAIMLSDNTIDCHHSNKTGVFPLISRINHSCSRNVHWIWNEKENKVFLIASRNIIKGEQLFTSYLGSHLFSYLSTKQERREYLLHHYGFYCECKLCNNMNEKECLNMENINKEWNKICIKLLESTSESIASDEELNMALRFVELSVKYYSDFGERLILSYEQLCGRFVARKNFDDAFKYFSKVLIEKALYNGYVHNINFKENDSEIMSWITLFPSTIQTKIGCLLKCTLNDVLIDVY